ncbi:hypothetical protein PsYK624_126820 [Phanerochaete sordida]|uniref:Uncharacterized protein n=1 Tax=Phanerochaete sordida TaxID=48140 RepID=A0A9P3GJU1_9APHY|nr:hypothetical protein PsYK624_126820 [Phanerochaete sordida]
MSTELPFCSNRANRVPPAVDSVFVVIEKPVLAGTEKANAGRLLRSITCRMSIGHWTRCRSRIAYDSLDMPP